MLDAYEFFDASLRVLMDFNSRVERISGLWFGDLGVERAASFHLCEGLFETFGGQYYAVPELEISCESGKIGLIDVCIINKQSGLVAAMVELKRDQFENEDDISRLRRVKRASEITSKFPKKIAVSSNTIIAVGSIWHRFERQTDSILAEMRSRSRKYEDRFRWRFSAAMHHRGQECFGATMLAIDEVAPDPNSGGDRA